MTLDFQNPFANYGNIAYGEHFIGRKDALMIIENRIIRPREAGNLAIIGLPRIGKSSLVYKALIEHKRELVTQNLLPIWINLGTYDEAPVFFRSLIIHCVDEMEGLNWLSEPIDKAACRVLDDKISWSEGYGHIQRFFEKVRQVGYRILFILDEFDHARYLFKGDIVGFQRLRDLADNPEWRVNFVTTSRRSIRDIESQTQAISTFDGIFHKHYLAMFNSDDLEEYFMRLESVSIPVFPHVKDRILFYCGGYPYLLEMLGYEITEMFREEQSARSARVEEAAHRVEQSFVDHYDRTISLLQEDGSLHKILQVLFGPVVDVKQIDIDELLRYGLITRKAQEKCVAFSEHFHTFLNLIEREVDLWPLWRETESALRGVITSKMLEQYGENWVEDLEKARPNLQSIFDKCREAQSREEKLFGSRASRSLIDFTYPQDLFAIIFAEWSIFKSVFGKDKNYWDQRGQLLGKIRTPLAHNRDESLYDDMRKTAEGYCKEILRIVKTS
ncbi:ATP-binding protein [Dehalococcoidia bacterium]|nr:ATP-binding protein [Dehalococcoidia bacterium]MCL0092233.1 ATP-binding protein [Dehalococcoidia bacterium]